MQEIIQFKSNQAVEIREENIGAILLDIKALQADGTTVCNIADLNQIAISLEIFRKGQGGQVWFNGYLDDLLSILSAGSTRYDIATTKRSVGYLIAIGFGGSIDLKGDDYAVLRVKAQTTAFTSLSTTNSDITIETVPSSASNPHVFIPEVVPYITGETNINKFLGNNVCKIVLANDFSANYSASTEAKPVNGVTVTASGYSKYASENLLLAENLASLQHNPDTEVKHLMVYNDARALSNVKFSALYDKAVGSTAKILVLRKGIV